LARVLIPMIVGVIEFNPVWTLIELYFSLFIQHFYH